MAAVSDNTCDNCGAYVDREPTTLCDACGNCGHAEQMDALRVEVADLKARLRRVGREWRNNVRDADLVDAALDLRRKNWRKP